MLSRGGFFPAQRVLSAAIAAVDIALWDIKGKRLGCRSVSCSAGPLQFSLTCPGVVVQEQPARPGTVLTDVVPVQPRWKDGHLLPLPGPGLGIELDRAAAAHPPRWTEPPHLRRRDGSFTNW